MFVNCEQAILEACPQLRLGHLQAKVVVCDSSDRFWQVAEPILQARAELDASDIRQTPVLAEARKAYKALGQDPSRYRLSAEALNRRMMKKQSLYLLFSKPLLNYVFAKILKTVIKASKPPSE